MKNTSTIAFQMLLAFLFIGICIYISNYIFEYRVEKIIDANFECTARDVRNGECTEYTKKEGK